MPGPDTEQMDSLRKCRSAAKGCVTRLITIGDQLMTSTDNYARVKELAAGFDTAYRKFVEAHERYHSQLTEPEELVSSQNYLSDADMVFTQFCEGLSFWLEDTKSKLDESDPGAGSDGAKSDARSEDASATQHQSPVKQTSSLERLRHEYDVKYQEMEMEVELERERLALAIKLKKEQRDRQSELEKMRQELTRLEHTEDVATGVGLTHSTPMSVPRHPQVTKPTADARDRRSFDPSEPSIAPADITQMLSLLDQSQRQHQILVESLQLPKTELSSFDGSPLQYWPFIRRFDHTMDKETITDATRLNTLLHCCTGKARELLRCCEVREPSEGYRLARRLLRERFGDSNQIAHSWIQKICDLPVLTGNAGLQEYADDLRCCKETLTAMGFLQEFETGQNLRTVLEKLPYRLRTRWLTRLQDIRRDRQPQFEDVVQFVERAACEVTDPVFGCLAESNPEKKKVELKPKKTDPKKADAKQQRAKGSFATQSTPTPTPSAPQGRSQGQSHSTAPKDPCWCCQGQHSIFKCPAFKSMKIKDRINLVRTKGRCMNCFAVGHMGRDCPRPFVCGIDGCDLKHSRFLHLRREPGNAPAVNTAGDSAVQPATTTPNQGEQASGSLAANCSYAGARNGKIALPIVPVRLRRPGVSTYVDTYALLDQGSTCTFCSQVLANTLGAPRQQETLELTTLNGKEVINTYCVELEASDLDDQTTINLGRVFTHKSISVGLSSFVTHEELQKWIHLRDIEIPDVDAKEVHLIIGNDTPQALIPLEVRAGAPTEPYATKTPFGWAINGPVGDQQTPTTTSSCFVTAVTTLQQQVNQFWQLEDVGRDVPPFSPNEKRVLDDWDNTAQMSDGHYMLGIPFKTGQRVCMPNNRAMADHRLASLGKRLARDGTLRGMYTKEIHALVANGYAEQVAESDDADGGVNYIPHHAVSHPRKPGKVRIVFDCAAKCQGFSLNDRVHQGPDLANKLVGVLLRFRQDRVAFMADVEAMFHQVRVTPTDRDALRFLWWSKDDIELPPQIYRMTVHLFGGVWSPSAANYALRRCATDNADDFSEAAVTTVLRNFYVDDCLKSSPDVETAVGLSQELRTILAKGGFKLTKWISTSRELLMTIPAEDHAKGIANLDLSHDMLPAGRALGVLWRIEDDVFSYDVTPLKRPATKRGILSTLSSVYDPLGFVSPFILGAKLIFQEACRLALDWDDDVPDEVCGQWTRWLDDLPDLVHFTLPRCLKPMEATILTYQLHHFADASTKAYGAVTYLRMTSDDGAVYTRLLVAKARLAPIKPTTVPRLELTAAVEAVKMDDMLRGELEVPLLESVFWTDSTIVLWYLANEDKRYQTFVANRVSRILESTTPAQWHHVGTDENPADDCSRGLTAIELCRSERWLSGPKFLQDSEDAWPVSPTKETQPDGVEVKRDAQVYTTDGATESPVDQLLAKYSTWHRMRKAVAWLRRFFNYLKNKKVPEECRLEPAELRRAEAAIVGYIQRQHLTGDTLKFHRYARLKPVMSPEGVLCVGGRLDRADLAMDVKHPWIIPADHHITTVMVNHYHCQLGHAGTERVLAEMRSRFWIIRGRASVRSVIGKCIPCRRARASTLTQEMSDLPADRVNPGDPPFSKVGVDYFGPITVRRGRTDLKRYGCLFTCLATRAIHLEVAYSLETDSFLNVLHRFVARRGKPQMIRSDNGTNFVGAKAELAKEIKAWNQQKIHESLLQKEIQWVFNPPGASHMGGVWERQIRTVRSVLTALLQQQRVDDDALHTVFCIAEGIVNGRPLTKLSDDPRDATPLTPNHLLLLRSGPVLPPCMTVPQDLYRKRWRQVQYLADLFWHRWTREYLPLLQERQKWTIPQRNIGVDDLVLVRHENTPRHQWPLGLVTAVYPGDDGKVRSARIRFNGSLYDRPITKLCLLEAADSR